MSSVPEGRAPGFAATLEVLGGKVSVNTGQGYKQVGTLTNVQPGDQVLVENGASANIVYSDGCTVHLGDNPARAVLSVAAQPPCGANAKIADPTSPSAGLVTGVIIAGGVAAGVAVALSSGGDSSKPSSP